MNRLKQGFTLVELVVVIAVIGILATVTVVGLSRYQADTRDANRVASATTIVEALEKYYDENGEYPSCAAITAAGSVVTTETLEGTTTKSLVAPQAAPGTTNSIKCETLSVNGTDIFEYQGDGSTSCSTNVACLGYTIKYKEETTGSIKSIESRRSTSIATAGAATISVSSVSFADVTLSWTAVQNASSYMLQRCTTSNCANGTTTDVPIGDTTSGSVGSLANGTQYWFRVRPDVTSTSGVWSNITTATTLQIATPNPSGVANSTSQITISWSAVPNALTYNLEYSTSPTLSSGVTPINGLTATSRAITGLSIGTTYYFRVKALNGSLESAWSSINNVTTVVPQPVCTASTLNSNTQITPTWNAASGATSYILDYSSNSNFTGATTITGITATSQAVTGLLNGTTYYFRVKAVNGASQSTAGSCPSATTGVNGPSSAGWYAHGSAVRNSGSIGWMPGQYPGGGNWWTVGMNINGTCSPGATVVVRLYSYYAYSNNTSANDASLLDWTYGNQELFVVEGDNSWYTWWQGWVACQVGSTRAGDTYLGNAGPY